MKNTSILLLFALTGFIFSNGCGYSPVAKVEGIVRCEGKPVPNALVFFQPEKGRLSQGLTQKDGTFVLSTYQDNDGAVIGHHTIRVAPSDWTLPNCPASLSIEKDLKEVEVVAGGNHFEIDIPKRGPGEKLKIPGD
jgi:hypothetical protein